MQQPETSVSLSDFALPETVAEENPELFSKTTVRHLVRNRHENGMADNSVVVRIGNRDFIHRGKFAQWFANQS